MNDTPETDLQAQKTKHMFANTHDYEDYATMIRHAGNMERERNQAIAERDKLAMHALELASYANESLEKNQPEFLEGLFERIEKYAKIHNEIYGNLEKLKEPTTANVTETP